MSLLNNGGQPNAGKDVSTGIIERLSKEDYSLVVFIKGRLNTTLSKSVSIMKNVFSIKLINGINNIKNKGIINFDYNFLKTY